MIVLKNLNWSQLSLLRNNDPRLLIAPSAVPRLGREIGNAIDIIDAWKDDFHKEASRRNQFDTLGSPFPYKGLDESGSGEDIEYAGYVVIPPTVDLENIKEKLPVVILFHTGAGPQDIFNRFQADKIAREKCWGETGCIVFVADILSDPIGWTWGDRDRYWRRRQELLEVVERDGKKSRWRLRDTLSAVIAAIKSIDAADANRIAGWGFCLGGQPVLELGRMQCDGVKGLITFHGLFDGASLVDKESALNNMSRRALICNGLRDPYVPINDLDIAKETFSSCGWECEVISFENAKHNFSNPRTKYGDDSIDGFGYDEQASNKSWESAIELIKDVFELP